MIRRVIKPIIEFAFWAFERPAPGLDLGLAILAGGWALTSICSPDVFDRQSYSAIGRMPDVIVVGVMGALCLAHAAVAWRPARSWRLIPLFASAFVWLCVAGGFAVVGTWTDVVAYALVGSGALLGVIYVETERQA